MSYPVAYRAGSQSPRINPAPPPQRPPTSPRRPRPLHPQPRPAPRSPTSPTPSPAMRPPSVGGGVLAGARAIAPRLLPWFSLAYAAWEISEQLRGSRIVPEAGWFQNWDPVCSVGYGTPSGLWWGYPQVTCGSFVAVVPEAQYRDVPRLFPGVTTDTWRIMEPQVRTPPYEGAICRMARQRVIVVPKGQPAPYHRPYEIPYEYPYPWDPLTLPIGVPMPHPMPMPLAPGAPRPRPNPRRDPREQPRRGPTPGPRPRPRPLPEGQPYGPGVMNPPSSGPLPQYPRLGGRPGGRFRPQRGPRAHNPRKPPPRNTRERKWKTNNAAGIMRMLAYGATEVIDFAHALYMALPYDVRAQYAGLPYGVALQRGLWENYDRISPVDAIENLIKNEIGDRIAGATAGRAGREATRRGVFLGGSSSPFYGNGS